MMKKEKEQKKMKKNKKIKIKRKRKINLKKNLTPRANKKEIPLLLKSQSASNNEIIDVFMLRN